MFFSFRSILAVTFLTGLTPLSVFGAPLSQVEDGLERRTLPAGHVFHINGQAHTLGAPIGRPGSTATVHHVEGHPGMVAKVFHGGGLLDHEKEAGHLDQVHEFHGAGDSAGHHIILATKHHGNTLEDTQAWQNANAGRKTQLRAQAAALATARNAHHAEYHNLIHTDANSGNVLYHEHDGQLTTAHFVDWRLASQAVKNNGVLDTESQRHVDRTGRVATHGVTR